MDELYLVECGELWCGELCLLTAESRVGGGAGGSPGAGGAGSAWGGGGGEGGGEGGS